MIKKKFFINRYKKFFFSNEELGFSSNRIKYFSLAYIACFLLKSNLK